MVGTIVNEYLSGRAFTPGERIRYNGVALDLSANGKVYISDTSANVDYVAVTTSDNKVATDVYLPGTTNLEPVTCIPIVPGQVLNLKLHATNAAIAIGDLIYNTGTSGTFNKKETTDDGDGVVIGKALEARDANDGGHANVKKNFVKVQVKR